MGLHESGLGRVGRLGSSVVTRMGRKPDEEKLTSVDTEIVYGCYLRRARSRSRAFFTTVLKRTASRREGSLPENAQMTMDKARSFVTRDAGIPVFSADRGFFLGRLKFFPQCLLLFFC